MCRPTKAKVKEFYGNRCQHCFRQFPQKKLQIHHIKPKREIRDESFANRIPLCGGSNTEWCHATVEQKFIYKNTQGKIIYDCEETRQRNIKILLPLLEERVPTLAA